MLNNLEQLTNQLFDGELSDSDCDRLNELLKHDECKRHFVELNKTHFCLCSRSLSSTVRPTALATSEVHRQILELAPTRTVVGDEAAPSQEPIRSRFYHLRGDRHYAIHWPIILSATAALLMLSVLGFMNWSSNNPSFESQHTGATVVDDSAKNIPGDTLIAPPETKGFAARIVSMSDDTLWDRDAGPGDFLMRLSVGEELKLTQGVVKLEFATSAYVVLSAPADLEILSPGAVILRHGKLTGRSEESDFIVETPSAHIVDVGTSFGVSVNGEEATDIVVFDGEVHVRRTSSSEQSLRLTAGMSVHADSAGLNELDYSVVAPSFDREFNGKRPGNLGLNELSLVDVICGSVPGEYRSAGSIDPETGTWSTLPWSETKGVPGKKASGKVVPVDWNPWIHSVFVPDHDSDTLTVDLDGGLVNSPVFSGGAWGPVWARRKIDRRLDPLVSKLDSDVEGFWGAGTTTALLDRSRWVRDGIVGLHANVGLTIDLAAIREEYSLSSLTAFRGVLAHLERSHVSQPFHPQAKASLQIYVDGELRYERRGFCRQDGDAMFGAELSNGDRLMSLIVTDGNDGPIYDRVVLLDPIFETANE